MAKRHRPRPVSPSPAGSPASRDSAAERAARAARSSSSPSALRALVDRFWPYAAGLLLILVVAAVVVAVTNNRPTGVPGEEAVPIEGRDHVPAGQAIQYRSYPPASGTHYGVWADYGFYDREVPEGEWVHNLEHGAVVVLYKCTGGPTSCPDLVNQLKEVYATFPPGKYGKVKMVITPYTKMENPITLVAWGWRLRLDRFDRDRMLQFYRAHVDRGPEDVP